jgi:hypothetical protein
MTSDAPLDPNEGQDLAQRSAVADIKRAHRSTARGKPLLSGDNSDERQIFWNWFGQKLQPVLGQCLNLNFY